MKGTRATTFIMLFILTGFLISGCGESLDISNILGKPKPETKKMAEQAKPAAVPEGTVLARVDDVYIILEEFNLMLDALPPEAKQIAEEPGRKRELLEGLIRRELLVKEAVARRMQDDPDIQEALEEFKKELLITKLLDREYTKIIATEEEVKAYYEAYKDVLKQPAELKVRQIIVATESEAKSALVDLYQGANFTALAKAKSKGPNAQNGGLRENVTAEDVFDNFREIVFHLEAGHVSPPFKGPEGYYIVKVEEKVAPEAPPFEEVKEGIKNTLILIRQDQILEDLIDRLKQTSEIEVHEDLLD